MSKTVPRPAGFAGTQTYLIECNRSQSKIDKNAPEEQNAKWTNQADFQLKRGDRVGVESCVLDAAVSSTNQTIEFTKENVLGKAYADNKVVLEFGFYINSNQRYSTNLPFTTKHHFKGNEPRAALGENSAQYEGNTVTTQQCGINSPQMPPLQQHIPANSVGFWHSMGKQYDMLGVIEWYGASIVATNNLTAPLTHIRYIVISNQTDLIPNTGGAVTPTNGCFNLFINDFYPPVLPMSKYRYTVPGLGGMGVMDAAENGWNTMGYNFEITVGMGVNIEAATGNGNPAGSDNIYARRVLGVVSNIWSMSDPNAPYGIQQALIQQSSWAGRLVIELRDQYVVQPTDNFLTHSGIIGFSQLGGCSQLNQFDKMGSASVISNPDVVAGVAKPYGACLPAWDRKAKAGGNIGALNWTTRFVKPAHPHAVALNWNSNFYPGYNPGGTPSPWYQNQEPAVVSNHFQGRRYTIDGLVGNNSSTVRKLGGGMGWEIMRATTDQLLMKPQECGAKIKVGSDSTSSADFQTLNYIDYKDNAPYILVCPSYQGANVVNPNGTGICPELQAMSAFVILEATEIFEDVNFLAQAITTAFHAVNPFNNLVNTSETHTQKKSKPNNVIPYVSEGHFPLMWKCASTDFNLSSDVPTPATAPDVNTIIPPTGAGMTYVTQLNQAHLALYTGVQPIWTGNLIKTIPANCRIPAPDMSVQKSDPFFYIPNENVDYGSSGGGDIYNAEGRGTFRWCQNIYGNMGIKDFAKAWSGDRLNKRAQVWNLNDPYSIDSMRNDCGRIILLNTQIENKTVTTLSPIWTPVTTGAVQPDKYALIAFTGAVIVKGQALLTNMYYNQDNCEMLNEILRHNEKYDNTAPDAVSGYDAQQAPEQAHNWYYLMDIGEADSSKPMRDKQGSTQEYWNTDWVATAPVNSYNPQFNAEAAATAVPQYLLATIQGWWMENPSLMCDNSPNPCYFPSYRIVEGANNLKTGTAPAPLTYNSEANIIISTRTMCCPAQSTWGNGFKKSYQNAKRTGVIKVHSRYFAALDTDIHTPDFRVEMANEATGRGCDPAMRNYAKDELGNWAIDPTLSKSNNIAATPYLYHTMATMGVTETGATIPPEFCKPKEFISFMAYKSYQPVDSDIETWELNQFSWGDFFGYSHSPYDNACIIPTNSNPVKITQEIWYSPENWSPSPAPAPAGEVAIGANDIYVENKSAYIWVGAGNASCVFDNEANRYKIGHLYTETLLPKFDAAATGDIPAATPQVGDQEISINADTESAKQVIFQGEADGYPITGGYDPIVNPVYYNAPAYPPQAWKSNAARKPPSAGNATNCADYPTNTYNKKDQAIHDTQTGVFLKNIWLPSKSWKPPEGIDLQNYYDPEIIHAQDTSINLGNATDNVGGATTVNGTKYTDKTAQNRNAIIAGLTEASREQWEGCLFDKMGFDYFDLMPPYGEQDNRYSEFTYGRTDIKIMNQGVKPLIMCTQADSAADIDLSVWGSSSPADMEGTPLFSQGFLNNETINIGGLNEGSIAAARMPTLFSSPFYKIISDIVEVQYQSSDQAQNCIFYGLKNYSAGSFLYIYASDFTQLVDMDRTITEVTTEIRNPISGRLARLSPNSCIIYKVQRDIFIPDPTYDVNGEDILQPKIHQEGEENLPEMQKLLNYEPEDAGMPPADTIQALEKIITHDIHGLEMGGLPEGVRASLTTAEAHAEKELLDEARSIIGSSFREERYIIDRPTLMKGIYKLIVEKALEEVRVVAKGSDRKNIGFLNPYLITNEIFRAQGRVAEMVSRIDGKQEEIDPAQILEELRTEQVHLGRSGQVVRRRGRIDGTLEGNYTFSPALLTQITDVLEKGGGKQNILQELQKAIENKEIGYKAKTEAGKKLKIGEKDYNLEDKDELYTAKGVISGRFKTERAARRSVKEMLGGTRAERMKAVAMAKRLVEEDFSHESEEERNRTLKREIELALVNPVRYMKDIVGDGAAGESKGGEISREERAGDLAKLTRELAAETKRGDIVQKEDDSVKKD